jgi:hypothetical protein
MGSPELMLVKESILRDRGLSINSGKKLHQLAEVNVIGVVEFALMDGCCHSTTTGEGSFGSHFDSRS